MKTCYTITLKTIQLQNLIKKVLHLLHACIQRKSLKKNRLILFGHVIQTTLQCIFFYLGPGIGPQVFSARVCRVRTDTTFVGISQVRDQK